MSTQNQFLTQTNYAKIVTFLQQHYSSKFGTPVSERVDTRIKKTVQHYMTEIARVRGGNAPVNVLNQEVLRETSASLDDWMRKQDSKPVMPPVSAPVPVRTKQEEPSFSDSFLTPEFRKSYTMDEEEDPLVLLNRIKKQREEEAKSLNDGPSMKVQEMEDVPPQAKTSPERLAPLPQDYIIPQENVIKYKEREYNIFLTSSDRDWFRNRSENRYSFSVIFNPGNKIGYGLSPAVQERFKNIQRVEFVKAIIPTESLTNIIRTTQKSPSVVTNFDRVVNLFSLPFIGVRIAELNNNGFSTNPREDNTFAIVQYDSAWNSDTSLSSGNPSKSRVGYTGFIPKHLKCQRIYEPTPLTNLQKMTIRLERHDGELLSAEPDVFGITRICLSSATTGIGAGGNNSVYSLTNNEYIFVQTSSWFPYSSISEGDSINIQGYKVATGTAAESTRIDFEQFINVPGGLYVVALAYVDSGNIIQDGSNSVGYSNILILRSRFDNPSTGSTARLFFGGSSTEEGLLETDINTQTSTASTAALINLSRQVHMVLRIITRDLDSSSNIRPDNV